MRGQYDAKLLDLYQSKSDLEIHETPQLDILGYAASFLYAAAAVFYSRQ